MRNHSKSWAAVRLAGLGLVAAASLAMSTTAAHAACLASSARCEQDTYAPTTPTYSIHCSNTILGVSGVDYDVPGRSLSLYNDEAEGAELFLNDEFIVNGPAVGSPITLHLRIRYHGTVASFAPGGGGNGVVGASALVAQAGDPPAAQKAFGDVNAPATGGTVPTFADSLDFVLPRTAGVPIGLQIHALIQNGYNDNLVGDFRFIDLPPGANVTSCEGYTQEQPVPALARSWGSVKAAYR